MEGHVSSGIMLLMAAADAVLIVYGIIQVVLYTILLLPWAEDYWYPDGSGYEKGSTKPVRRRIALKIAIVVVLLIITTIVDFIILY